MHWPLTDLEEATTVNLAEVRASPGSTGLTCTVCSSWVPSMDGLSRWRSCVARELRNGSRQVTNARLPARLLTIKCADLRMCVSSASKAKSCNAPQPRPPSIAQSIEGHLFGS